MLRNHFIIDESRAIAPACVDRRRDKEGRRRNRRNILYAVLFTYMYISGKLFCVV